MSYTVIRPASHEAWLAERLKGIGASDAGTVLGCNPHSTPYTLWAKRKGILEPDQENEQMMLGHILEPAVAEAFAKKTGAFLDRSSEGDWIARDTERPWLQVSPDYLYWPAGVARTPENRELLECKTRGVFTDQDSYPDYWYCQVQYQMGVTGIRTASLAWLCPEQNHLHVDYIRIPFNEPYYAMLEGMITDFWLNNIVAGVAPEIEPQEASLKFRSPVKGSSVPADKRVKSLLRSMKSAKESGDSDKDALETLKNELKMFMGDAENLIDPDDPGKVYISWKSPEPSVKLDDKAFFADPAVTAFLEANPGLYEKHLVTVQGERKFLPKWAKIV